MFWALPIRGAAVAVMEMQMPLAITPAAPWRSRRPSTQGTAPCNWHGPGFLPSRWAWEHHDTR